MEMMMLDPNTFTIDQSKNMGLWPTPDLCATSMYPYIKRMSNKVNVVDVGTMKGENAVRFIELDMNNKIDTIFSIKTCDDYDDLMEKNLKAHYGKVIMMDPKEPVDLVCINSKTDLDKTLKKYYDLVKSNGIFCGNNHSEEKVKQALIKFRRENRIGTPISVAHDCWFWYKR